MHLLFGSFITNVGLSKLHLIVSEIKLKGEVSPGILCRLGKWRMILETKQQKWANLDNPIKRYDFSKVSLSLCMSPSQVAFFQYL